MQSVNGFISLIYGAVLSLVFALPTIVGNVIVFATCPPLADIVERHATFTGKERLVCMKMAMFQVTNTLAASFSFLFFLPTNGLIGRAWYPRALMRFWSSCPGA